MHQFHQFSLKIICLSYVCTHPHIQPAVRPVIDLLYIQRSHTHQHGALHSWNRLHTHMLSRTHAISRHTHAHIPFAGIVQGVTLEAQGLKRWFNSKSCPVVMSDNMSELFVRLLMYDTAQDIPSCAIAHPFITWNHSTFRHTHKHSF